MSNTYLRTGKAGTEYTVIEIHSVVWIKKLRLIDQTNY